MSLDRLVILYGGRSGEHEVSLLSTASIVRNLDPLTYSIALVGIDHEGAWHLQSPAVAEAIRTGDEARLESGDENLVSVVPGRGLVGPDGPIACDVVFPVLHGTYGEDGRIQGLLSACGIPYVGAGVAGSAIGFDKELSKRLWIQAGLPVVPFARILSHEDPEQAVDAAERRFGYPIFIKPARLGSSVGIVRAADRTAAMEAVGAAFAYDTKVILEPQVSAREIECSVLGYPKARAFPPGEIVPSHAFYTYEAKYIDPAGARLCIPAEMDDEDAAEVMRLAVAAFEAVDGEGMARVDFFLEKKTGKILLNEINTIPGFTRISMFPRMAAAAGLAYADLLAELIAAAVERGRVEKSLRYRYD